MLEPKAVVAVSDASDAVSGAPRLALKRLHPRATVPAYQSAGSAGMDLSACIDSDVTLVPGQIALVPTGWAVAIPPGFEGQVRPRSGLATKFGVTVPNAPGTIDSDYRGELKVRSSTWGDGRVCRRRDRSRLALWRSAG